MDNFEDDELMNETVRNGKLLAIAGDYDWESIAELDSFLWMFDHLPERMRLIVDLKITGTPDFEIAKMMDITERTVKNQLSTAKKRFLRSIR